MATPKSTNFARDSIAGRLDAKPFRGREDDFDVVPAVFARFTPFTKLCEPDIGDRGPQKRSRSIGAD